MSKKGENITKRKDGRWEARVICGYDETGRAKYRSIYGKSYREAKAKKEKEQSRIFLCQTRISPNFYTVRDLIAEFLLHKKLTVKTSTLAHYKNLMKNHIAKDLGKIRLSHLSSTLIEKYAQSLLDSGKVDGRGLSPKTVKDILCLLRSMLKYAVLKQYVPAEILSFSSLKTPKKQISVLSQREFEILENFALSGDDSYRFGLFLCLYSGLRIGEICGLMWNDIDFAQSVLLVRRTIQRVTDIEKGRTQILITEPKTSSGIRVIPLPCVLLGRLWSFRQRARGETSYVLTGTEKYIEPSNYYMRYQRWLKKLQIDRYPFHTLRHTFATRCIENGFDAKSLSEILGHADVRITLNRYVHPTMELKRSHMERLLPPSPSTPPSDRPAI